MVVEEKNVHTFYTLPLFIEEEKKQFKKRKTFISSVVEP
jgi:hypothetical protein